jgi:hypothetical protein
MSTESQKQTTKTSSSSEKKKSEAELKAEEAEKQPPQEPPEPVDSDEELLDDGTYRPVHPHESGEENSKEKTEDDDKDGAGKKTAVDLTVSPDASSGATKGDAAEGTTGTASDPATDTKNQLSTPATDPKRPVSPTAIPVSFHSANLRVSSQTNRPPVHRQVIFDQWYPRYGTGSVRLREFDSNVDVEGAVCMQAFPSQGFTGVILGEYLCWNFLLLMC